MIVVAAITLCLVLVGIGAFIYGTYRLAQFAFRVSTGRGIAAILFPPYTFYFAFAELEEEEKAIPTASWMFGLVVSAMLTVVFFQPIQLLLSGQFDKLATNPGDAASAEYVSEGADTGPSGSADTGTSSDTAAATGDAGDTGAPDVGTQGDASSDGSPGGDGS